MSVSSRNAIRKKQRKKKQDVARIMEKLFFPFKIKKQYPPQNKSPVTYAKCDYSSSQNGLLFTNERHPQRFFRVIGPF